MENYTIYDEIGRGTHSFVYKARRKRSIEYVAVKSTAKSRMDKASCRDATLKSHKQNILNEVQLLHKLDSRYVLKFFNWYESQNHIWLIFEYCIGGDLLNLVTQDRRLPEPAVKAFGWELVAGLQYLHANGILYCDLKPANVLIDECGSLKLADFGLARRIPTRESMAGNAQLGPGSPQYMAPELFQPLAIHSFASDFWALGCVLYELCTGRPPFTHTFFPELARIIQTEPLVIPEEGYAISAAFADLMVRLLEKDPYRRMTWSEVVRHPYWVGCTTLDEMPFPPQELFEASRPSSGELHAESQSIAVPKQTAASGRADLNEFRHQHSETEPGSIQTSSTQASDDEEEEADQEEEKASGQSESDDGGGDESEEIVMEEVLPGKIRPVTAPAIVQKKMPVRGNSGLAAGNANPIIEIYPQENERAPRTAPPGDGRQRTMVTLQSDVRGKSPMFKASRLLYTTADSSVKPIAFCGDIEVVPVPQVRPEKLDFETLSPEILSGCTTEDLEDHLKSIYISLKSAELGTSDKVNVLAHLISLCREPKLANVIVNSSLLTLLIKMLHRTQEAASSSVGNGEHTAMIVPSIALVLGALFRFATLISPASPDHIHNLAETLSQIVHKPKAKGSDESLLLYLDAKRRAMACAGELLFYLATKKEGSFPSAGITCLVKALDDDDTVTRHYAIRTVTNILAKCSSNSMALGLVSDQVGFALIRTLTTAHSGNRSSNALQTCTTQALAQVFRRFRVSSERTSNWMRTKLSMTAAVSKTTVLASLWRGVEASHTEPELAIASLNVLNSYLDCTVDRDKDEAIFTSFSKHKRVLLERIVTLPVFERLLEVRSKYEEDSQLPGRRNGFHGHGNRTSSADAGRRYEDDDRVLPRLVRAKAILFVHFGILRSTEFARVCVKSCIVDKVEPSLAPYVSSIRTGQSSQRRSTYDPPGAVSVASPRQLPAFDQYVLQCGLNLVRICIRTALKMSADCISSSNKVVYEDGDSAHPKGGSVVTSEPFQLFEQLIRNPTCRAQLCYYFLLNEGKEFRFFIRLMSKLLTSFSTERLDAMETNVGAVISRLLLRLFQSSSSDASALIGLELEELFVHLLPAVVVQLQHLDEASDGKDDEADDDHSVNCVRLVYLVMLHLDYELSEPEMTARDNFIQGHLLPCFQVLFGPRRPNENVWRFAIELLQGLATRDAGLVDLFSSGGRLGGPIVALLSSPSEHGYNSLPASATALVRSVVEASKKAGNIRSMYLLEIGTHLKNGLEYVVSSNTRTAATVDLLEVLCTLLNARYEERRGQTDSSAPAGFDSLVQCGPLLLSLCAQSEPGISDPEPQDSPSSKIQTRDQATATHPEIMDAASRCLMFTSQLFGVKLNELLFGKTDVARSFTACLQLSHEDVSLLRVVLTIKNSLRCDKKSDAPLTQRWLQSDRQAMIEIVRISKRPRDPRSLSREQSEIIKAAAEILALFQTSPSR